MEETKKRGLSGAVLKWIALVTMLIDHIGLTVVYQALIYDRDLWLNDTMMTLYAVLRSVGRLAFPLFCFLLAEGFRHTSSRGKYLLRLAVFALLSEIPFDLAVNSRVIEFSSQNVFFTLLLGFSPPSFYQIKNPSSSGTAGRPFSFRFPFFVSCPVG